MGTYGNSKRKKREGDYKFSIKLYPDSREYDCRAVIDRLCEFFREYAYITHDKDKPIHKGKIKGFTGYNNGNLVRGKRERYLKPHIHYYGKNNHSCHTSLDSLVAYCEIPHKYAENRDFEYAKDWGACMNYIDHKSRPEKYQYPVSAIHTNIENWFHKYRTSCYDARDESEKVVEVIEQYLSDGIVPNYMQVFKKLSAMGCQIQLRQPTIVRYLVDSAWAYRQSTEFQQVQRVEYNPFTEVEKQVKLSEYLKS